jgi:hypothetical protein
MPYRVHFSMPVRMLLAGVLAASIALLAVLTIDGPAPAGAATGNCPGTLIESRNLNVGGKKIGELDVYYDRSTGKNCARMNHAGSTWNKPHRTRAWIGICSETRPGGGVCHYDRSTDAVDDDTYRFYAGPVTTKVSAAGKCIAASGYLWIGGKRHDVYTTPWPGHCG